MDALTGALADLAPEDRPELLQWVAARGFLGIVHASGPEAAAKIAYRMADTLAGSIR